MVIDGLNGGKKIKILKHFHVIQHNIADITRNFRIFTKTKFCGIIWYQSFRGTGNVKLHFFILFLVIHICY